MMHRLSSWLIYTIGSAGSLFLAALFLPARLPGMTLMGYGIDWLLIWLVGWSLRQPIAIAAGAGIAIGLLQDALTIPTELGFFPTHALGLALTGGCTAMLQKQRYLEEDFISVALIVFGMAVIAETVYALQWTILGRDILEVWTTQQRVALCSAVLTSLWSPVLYFPLSHLHRWRTYFAEDD